MRENKLSLIKFFNLILEFVFLLQAQLLGESLYNYICPEDHEELTKNLSFNDAQRNSSSLVTEQLDESSNSSDEFSFKEEQRRSFSIRIAQRTVSRREHIQYECFHVSGSLCLANACRNASLNVNRLRQRGTWINFSEISNYNSKSQNRIIQYFDVFVIFNIIFVLFIYLFFVNFYLFFILEKLQSVQ